MHEEPANDLWRRFPAELTERWCAERLLLADGTPVGRGKQLLEIFITAPSRRFDLEYVSVLLGVPVKHALILLRQLQVIGIINEVGVTSHEFWAYREIMRDKNMF
ncbi:MAG: hypothetical protein Greene101449_213 [Candidatus Peregrinibacteria bacterium Greene1014_49]|nr:MAG: hypothetical protein Greene101449_213 [Candidatus Peregrinibacteria bacterium Greene1014_49]